MRIVTSRLLKIPRLRFMSSTQATVVHSSEQPGPIEVLIVEKIRSNLKPSYLLIANDSHKHSHHKPMQQASNQKESHFRIEVVSNAFSEKNMPSRHRMIYQLLEDEFQNQGLHALQMKTRTEDEALTLKSRKN